MTPSSGRLIQLFADFRDVWKIDRWLITHGNGLVAIRWLTLLSVNGPTEKKGLGYGRGWLKSWWDEFAATMRDDVERRVYISRVAFYLFLLRKIFLHNNLIKTSLFWKIYLHNNLIKNKFFFLKNIWTVWFWGCCKNKRWINILSVILNLHCFILHFSYCFSTAVFNHKYSQ